MGMEKVGIQSPIRLVASEKSKMAIIWLRLIDPCVEPRDKDRDAEF